MKAYAYQMLTLGEKIRELRERNDLSVRGLARELGVSAAFMSDIELGRRHPGEDKLKSMADILGVPLAELQQHDARAPLAEIRRLSETNPAVGFAFRTAMEDLKSGNITHEELIRRLTNKKK